MEHIRGFEIVDSWKKNNISLPRRKTALSAGYDMESAADTELVPQIVTMVPTGLKAYMKDDEFLGIFIRSGLAVKNGLMLANGMGVIDADYYNNPENEGHIFIAIYNMGKTSYFLHKGDRIAQGVFLPYFKTDHDDAAGERIGGIGSTGV